MSSSTMILTLLTLLFSSFVDVEAWSSCYLSTTRGNAGVHLSSGLMTSDDNSNVNIYDTSESLKKSLCADIVKQGSSAIKADGSFCIAVPGGSVLKLLSGLKDHKNDLDWTKVHLFYVNHKCVEADDPTSTHVKAKKIFLDDLSDINVYDIAQTDNLVPGHDTIAHSYASKINSVVKKSNFPQFDYMLLGVGKDGHIGSLYPDRKEVLNTNGIVLSVDEKTPPSITLSLSIMNNAKAVRVVMTGEDKAEAAASALLAHLPPTSFPVCGIDTKHKGLIWLLDKEAGSKVASKIGCKHFN